MLSCFSKSAASGGAFAVYACIGENENVAMPDSLRTLAPPYTDVPGAIAEIRAGRMIVLSTMKTRKRGDLTLAAEFVTPEAINFMAKFAGAWSA